MPFDGSKIVATTRPDLTALLPELRLYQDSYLGGRFYENGGYLFTHRQELPGDFERRKLRAVYRNLCAPAIDDMVALLFGGGYTVSPDVPVTLKDDCDLSGNDFAQFWQRATRWAGIYTHAWVVVDKPPVVEGESEASAATRGVRPYMRLFMPGTVPNWGVDRTGGLTFAVLIEPAVIDGDGSEEHRRALWTRDEWTRYAKGKGKDEWSVIARGPNPTGMIPAIPFSLRENPDDPVIGRSLLEDIARINRMHYNLVSRLDEITARFAHPQLVAQGDASEYSSGDDASKATVNIGASSIFLYPMGRNAPQYISPPQSNADTLAAMIADYAEAIRELSNRDPAATGEGVQESGIAKYYRRVTHNARIGEYGNRVSDTMEKALNLASRWDGGSVEYTVTFPDDFAKPSALEAVELAQRMAGLFRSPEALAMLSEFITRKSGAFDDDEAEKIIAAETAWATSEGTRAESEIGAMRAIAGDSMPHGEQKP